jgi:uncharacterized protein
LPPLVTPTLLTSLAGLAVVVGAALIAYGGLRPRDLGLRRANLVPAVAGVLGAWLGMQAIVAAGLVLAGTPLQVAEEWSSGLLVIAGGLAAQLAGNALLEEIAWRGYLLRQLVAAAGGAAIAHPATRYTLAVLVPSLLFALAHAPNRLLVGGAQPADLPAQLVALTFAGLAFAAVYLASRNLWFTVGIHALVNQPVPLFAGGDGHGALAIGTGLLIATGWALARSRRRPSRSAGASSEGL